MMLLLFSGGHRQHAGVMEDRAASFLPMQPMPVITVKVAEERKKAEPTRKCTALPMDLGVVTPL